MRVAFVLAAVLVFVSAVFAQENPEVVPAAGAETIVEQVEEIPEPAVEEPAVVEESVIVEEPVVVGETVVEEPAVVEQPVVVEEPVVEVPAIEEPVVKAPVVVAEPELKKVDVASETARRQVFTDPSSELPDVYISESVLFAYEGQTLNYTIVLTHQPGVQIDESIDTDADDVTVSITSSMGEYQTQLTFAVYDAENDVALDQQDVSFDSTDWNIPQTVLVTAFDDDVYEPEVDNRGLDATVFHNVTSTDFHYDGIAVNELTVSVTDDDPPVVLESTANPNPTEGESGLVTMELVLASEPTADVEVTMTDATPAIEGNDLGAEQVTYTPSAVTFTAADWNVPQQIEVRGVEDNVDEGTERNTTVVYAVNSDDAYYQDIPVCLSADMEMVITYAPEAMEEHGIVCGATVTVTDNDDRDLVINGDRVATTADHTCDTEEGVTDCTYTVELATAPVPDATVTVTVHEDYPTVNLEDNELEFFLCNYDDSTEAAEYATIDPSTVTTTDACSTDATGTNTAGATGHFQEFSGGNADLVQRGNWTIDLLFDDSNWNIAQTVTVVAWNDWIDEPDTTRTVYHTVSGEDPTYDMSFDASTVEDSDTYAYVTSDFTGFDQLATTPTVTSSVTDNDVADVILGCGDGTLDRTDDADTDSLSDTGTSCEVSSSESGYDDDGASFGSYTIELQASPGVYRYNYEYVGENVFEYREADVEIVVTPQSTLQTEFDPASVTFTASNWNVGQEVTVKPIDDNIDETQVEVLTLGSVYDYTEHVVTSSISSSVATKYTDATVDSEYDQVSEDLYWDRTIEIASSDRSASGLDPFNHATLTEHISDNDLAEVIVSETHINATEGGSFAYYTLELNSDPYVQATQSDSSLAEAAATSHTVTITVNEVTQVDLVDQNGERIWQQDSTYTFTHENWNIPQYVYVYAHNDKLAPDASLTDEETYYNVVTLTQSIGGDDSTYSAYETVYIDECDGVDTTDSGRDCTQQPGYTPSVDVGIIDNDAIQVQGEISPCRMTSLFNYDPDVQAMDSTTSEWLTDYNCNNGDVGGLPGYSSTGTTWSDIYDGSGTNIIEEVGSTSSISFLPSDTVEDTTYGGY